MSPRGPNPRLQINARLVKEKDRARARELRRLLLCGAAIVVPLLVYVWQRVDFLRVSYEVEAMKNERQKLQEQNKQLTVERSFLLSPDRIEHLARKEIGLIDPGPSDVRRVAVVDGRINEVATRADTGAPPADSPRAAAARRTPRARRRPAPHEDAGAHDATSLEAGVGVLPVTGTPAPESRQQEEEAP
jgi:cell division protein FtsL